MKARLRPFATTGVAIVGAGAIAFTPLAPPQPDVRVVESAVQLTADSDWADIFAKAQSNASARANSWLEAPFPILQQIIANQLSYLAELPDVAAITQQIQANFEAALGAPTRTDLTTLDNRHAFIYNALFFLEGLPIDVGNLVGVKISPLGKQLLAFSTTSLSGVLFGLVGPVLGPAVVFASNSQSIFNDLTEGNLAGAGTTLADTVPQMTNAFLNGGVHTDITGLIKEVGPLIGLELPDGFKLGVAFGGLLSPGGSVFNALDMDYDLLDLGLINIHLATGIGPGPIASLIRLTRVIARAIGWDGTGSPRAPSERSALAPANEVPQSVLNSPVAKLTAPITESVDTGTNLKTRVGAASDAVVAASSSAGNETVSAISDRKQVLDKTIRESSKAAPGEFTTTRSAGDRHRADAVSSVSDRANSAAHSGSAPKRPSRDQAR